MDLLSRYVVLPRSIREASREYRDAFAPYYLEAVRYLRVYAASLRPGLEKVFASIGNLAAEPYPSNLKPHPVWMAQFFGLTDLETVTEVFIASSLMELHCCLQDRRIDQDERGEMNFATSDALSNVLMADSLVRFSAFASKPQFHAAVRNSFFDLAEAYMLEASGSLPYLTPEKMFQAVVNRAAPFHILVAALAYRTGQLAKIEPCSRMACHLIMWFQILDDLTDWQQDLEKRRYTYLLHRLQPFIPGKPMEMWTREEVADALYLYGGFESLVVEGTAQLESALAIAKDHAAQEALSGEGASLTRWLRIFIDVQTKERQWSIDRKWEFIHSIGPQARAC
jgi:hypothetical protein